MLTKLICYCIYSLMPIFTLLLSAFFIASSAYGETICENGANPLVKNALLHLQSFDYVHHAVEQWELEGNTVCLKAWFLNKNIYQYHLVFVKFEARNPQGELKAMLPLLFQTSSVQGHENGNQHPWNVLPVGRVNQIFDQFRENFQPANSLPGSPDLFSASFVGFLKSQPVGKGISEDSFNVFSLGKKIGNDELALATWLELVPGTGSGTFTQQVSAKALLLRRSSAGVLEIDSALSGFNNLCSPLNDLLEVNQQVDPRNSEARKKLVLDLSRIQQEL